MWVIICGCGCGQGPNPWAQTQSKQRTADNSRYGQLRQKEMGRRARGNGRLLACSKQDLTFPRNTQASMLQMSLEEYLGGETAQRKPTKHTQTEHTYIAFSLLCLYNSHTIRTILPFLAWHVPGHLPLSPSWGASGQVGKWTSTYPPPLG